MFVGILFLDSELFNEHIYQRRRNLFLIRKEKICVKNSCRCFLGFFHLTLHIIPGFFMFPYFQNFFKNTSIRGGVTCSSLGRRKDVLKILVIVYFFGYLLLFLFSTNFVYIDKCFVLYTYKDVCREVSWAFFISPFILFLDF